MTLKQSETRKGRGWHVVGAGSVVLILSGLYVLAAATTTTAWARALVIVGAVAVAAIAVEVTRVLPLVGFLLLSMLVVVELSGVPILGLVVWWGGYSAVFAGLVWLSRGKRHRVLRYFAYVALAALFLHLTWLMVGNSYNRSHPIASANSEINRPGSWRATAPARKNDPARKTPPPRIVELGSVSERELFYWPPGW
jgi:hypothetical protein